MIRVPRECRPRAPNNSLERTQPGRGLKYDVDVLRRSARSRWPAAERQFPLVVARYPCYCGSVIRSFGDRGTEDVFNGKNTPAARRSCPKAVWSTAFRKLDQIDSAMALSDLRLPPGNRLEALKGDRKGQYGIRINSQFRICFRWSAAGADEVEIVDYHR